MSALWRLGVGARFRGRGYICFPGNVAGEASMTDVVRALRDG